MSGFEFGASALVELIQGIRAEVGQRMTFKPCPQVFDRIEFRRVSGQTLDNDIAFGRIDILAHQLTAVWPGSIPNNQHSPTMVRLESFTQQSPT